MEAATDLAWRQLQTFPHGALFHLIHLTFYQYECKKCKVPNNLYHMV